MEGKLPKVARCALARWMKSRRCGGTRRGARSASPTWWRGDRIGASRASAFGACRLRCSSAKAAMNLSAIRRSTSQSSTCSREGADAWYRYSPEQILPAGYKCAKCGSTEFRKEMDIVDVWFESGSSQAAVLGHEPGLPWPADLLHRGRRSESIADGFSLPCFARPQRRVRRHSAAARRSAGRWTEGPRDVEVAGQHGGSRGDRRQDGPRSSACGWRQWTSVKTSWRRTN